MHFTTLIMLCCRLCSFKCRFHSDGTNAVHMMSQCSSVTLFMSKTALHCDLVVHNIHTCDGCENPALLHGPHGTWQYCKG